MLHPGLLQVWGYSGSIRLAHWCRAAVSDYHAIWGPPRWAPEWPVSTSSLLPLTLSSAPVPSQVSLGSSHPFADQGRSPNCRGAVTLPLPQQLSDHRARCAVLSETHPRGLALAGVCGGALVYLGSAGSTASGKPLAGSSCPPETEAQGGGAAQVNNGRTGQDPRPHEARSPCLAVLGRRCRGPGCVMHGALLQVRHTMGASRFLVLRVCGCPAWWQVACPIRLAWQLHKSLWTLPSPFLSAAPSYLPLSLPTNPLQLLQSSR